MKHGGRLSAAIEILETLQTTPGPVSGHLRDWGKAHRFAGSQDRAIIANLVYDALRKLYSYAHRAQSDNARDLIFMAVLDSWGMPLEELIRLINDDKKFGPDPITAREKERFERAISPDALDDAPDFIKGDYPEWLDGDLRREFGEDLLNVMQANSQRAPIDLRVNTLKATRDEVIKDLEGVTCNPIEGLENAIRIPAATGPNRAPNVEVEPAFQKGWFEIQDKGSQLAALACGAQEGMNILDYCAGGGGKTLAFAATMNNTGQIYAYDKDKHRLAPIHQRLLRAGVTNTEVLRADEDKSLKPLIGQMDRVVIDAPCSGTGTWRRKPEAKWNLKPQSLEKRIAEQNEILKAAIKYLRPGGELIYITCSLLPQEKLSKTRMKRIWEEGGKKYEIVESKSLNPYHDDCDGFHWCRVKS